LYIQRRYNDGDINWKICVTTFSINVNVSRRGNDVTRAELNEDIPGCAGCVVECRADLVSGIRGSAALACRIDLWRIRKSVRARRVSKTFFSPFLFLFRRTRARVRSRRGYSDYMREMTDFCLLCETSEERGLERHNRNRREEMIKNNGLATRVDRRRIIARYVSTHACRQITSHERSPLARFYNAEDNPANFEVAAKLKSQEYTITSSHATGESHVLRKRARVGT